MEKTSNNVHLLDQKARPRAAAEHALHKALHSMQNRVTESLTSLHRQRSATIGSPKTHTPQRLPAKSGCWDRSICRQRRPSLQCGASSQAP